MHVPPDGARSAQEKVSTTLQKSNALVRLKRGMMLRVSACQFFLAIRTFARLIQFPIRRACKLEKSGSCPAFRHSKATGINGLRLRSESNLPG